MTMLTDHATQALTFLREKNFSAARDSIIAYAQNNALEFQHFLVKGLSELALEDWSAAQHTFSDATELFPHQPQLWLNLGIAQENLNLLDEAAESFERSLELKEDQGDIYGNLSNIYRKLGRFTEAERMAHRAYETGASKAQSLNALSLAFSKQGKYDAADLTLKDALRLEPNNPDILANYANLAVDQLNFEAAWPRFAAARTADNKPVIRRDEGMARMLAADYEAGWPLYEARLELPSALRLHPPCPRYRGTPLIGKKLLLLAEQGFGDTIMFCRYGRFLAEFGPEITWVVPQPLLRLLSYNLPDRVISEADPLPDADYYLPIMSLPLETHKPSPMHAPVASYLKPPLPSTPALAPAAPDKKKIGLVWMGSPTHERDHERSIPLEQFAPLFERVKAQFYAPFTGAGLDEITEPLPVISLAKLITDFADTAALLSQLDCLVTVDTAAAHLAGALGVTTYLLLPHCPDWRWGADGETTPWYPSLTLLRQPRYGNWSDVIARLVEKLA